MGAHARAAVLFSLFFPKPPPRLDARRTEGEDKSGDEVTGKGGKNSDSKRLEDRRSNRSSVMNVCRSLTDSPQRPQINADLRAGGEQTAGIDARRLLDWLTKRGFLFYRRGAGYESWDVNARCRGFKWGGGWWADGSRVPGHMTLEVTW